MTGNFSSIPIPSYHPTRGPARSSPATTTAADHSIDLDLIDPRWWEFIHFNEERRCLQANPGYTFRELQNAKYHIKPKTKKTS